MLLRELTYSARNLLRAPIFAITAILTLALGVAASTAVFTVVDSVILKPLSYRESGQLVIIWEKVKFLTTAAEPYTGANPRHEVFWADHTKAFSGLCLLNVGTRGVSIGVDHPRLIGSLSAQANLLDILKVTPLLGRKFVASDDIAGHDKIAIITYSLWQNLFHGDAKAVGRTLHIAGTPYQIVGVLPNGFHFPKRSVLSSFPSKQSTTTAPPVEILLPLAIDPGSYGWNSDYGNWVALGRLKPGISVSQAEAEMNILQKEIVDLMPAGQRERGRDTLLAFVQPMQDAMIGSSRNNLWTLMAAVIGLMLIACVNLANAQLARAVSREREAAVRSALGARKWHLIWSSLSESLLLSVIGGAAGVLLAFGALAVFRANAPFDLPRMNEIHPNLSVLGFAIVILIGSALLFGVMPAINFVRTDPQKALQQNSARTQGSRRSRRLRFTLIGVQVFGCTALLLVTGLFAKSLATMLRTDRGLDTTNVVTAQVNLPGADGQAYEKNQRRAAFDDRVLSRLGRLPGVQSAALYSTMPLEGETWIDDIARPDKHTEHNALANIRWVSPGYFELMRERLIAGRFFERRDRNAKNAVISESAARAIWPKENPVGRPFKLHDRLYTVIGIVADSRTNSLKLPATSMIYLDYHDNPPYATFFMVKSSQNPQALVSDVRRAIWAQDPEVTIARVKTLDAQVKDSLSAERFQTFILIAFGIAALLLAMLGIYGILSYSVAGRTQEIGLRMALGATRQGIYSLTLSEAAAPVFSGLTAGWFAGVLAGKLVQKLLCGVTAIDFSVTVMVASVLVACAAAASFLPARRAASIDPMQALRAE